jgi:hypothetical protein
LRLAAVSDTNLWLTQILVTVYRILTPQQSFCVWNTGRCNFETTLCRWLIRNFPRWS